LQGSLAPGTNCSLVLEGADDKKTSGTVTITTNAYATPQKFVIWKSPTGDNVGPTVMIFPQNLQFPPQLMGTKSSPQTFTVRNTGLQPAAINSIFMIPPSAFKETNNCPALLQPATSCTVSVTYTPASVQDEAQLGILHDPNQTRDTVFLMGLGNTSSILASTPTTQFGSQFVGGPGVSKVVNFMNTTPYPAVVTGISTSAGFTETNTCGTPLAPQASCRVAVVFAPSGNQNVAGTLTAGSAGPGGAQTVNLLGTGMATGDLGVSPVALSFAGTVGFTTAAETVTVTNNTQNDISINSIGVQLPFLETTTCGTTISAGASCQIDVSFKPTQTTPANGTLQIAYGGNGSPQVVGLSGTAQEMGVTFYPLPISFGQQPVRVASAQLVAFVENNSPQQVSLKSIAVQGSEFTIAHNHCGKTLAANAGCQLDMVFTPSATGVRAGTLTVTASDSTSPHVANLEGVGISQGLGTAAPTSVAFPPQRVGTKSGPRSVTVTNTGTGPLILAGIVASPTFFTQTNNCSASLAAGASCTVEVQFAPNLLGLVVGTLTVQDDGAGSPHSVALSGIGK
jgi:hypothetical protein